jgi:hypothetical protein
MLSADRVLTRHRKLRANNKLSYAAPGGANVESKVRRAEFFNGFADDNHDSQVHAVKRIANKQTEMRRW